MRVAVFVFKVSYYCKSSMKRDLVSVWRFQFWEEVWGVFCLRDLEVVFHVSINIVESPLTRTSLLNM